MKTKKQVVEEMIASNQEEIYKMEIVRDFQSLLDNTQAKEQVAAAIQRIDLMTKQIEWLKTTQL